MKKTLLPLLLLPLCCTPSWGQTQKTDITSSVGAESVVDRINSGLVEKGIISQEDADRTGKKYAYDEMEYAQKRAAEESKQEAVQQATDDDDCTAESTDEACAEKALALQAHQARMSQANTVATIRQMQREVLDGIKHPSDRTEIAIGLETDVEALFPSSGFYPPPKDEKAKSE